MSGFQFLHPLLKGGPYTAASIVFAAFGVFFSNHCKAQLTVVASDSFSYSAGTLAGKNGGSGWNGAWVWDYLSGGSLGVSATGLNYSGLSSTGGSAVWASGGNGISDASRALPRMDSGVVYLQFLCQFGSTSGGGTPNIRLFDGSTLTGGFGGNGGTYGGVMSILNTSLNAASDGSSSSSAALSGLNLVIARIDYQNNQTKMWVNPDLSTFDYQNPAAANATYSSLAPVFDHIAIYTRSPGSVDELTVMTVVPEPKEMLFVTASVLIFAVGVRALQSGRI